MSAKARVLFATMLLVATACTPKSAERARVDEHVPTQPVPSAATEAVSEPARVVPSEDARAAPGVAARVAKVTGQATLFGSPEPLSVGLLLSPGGLVVTENGAELTLDAGDGSRFVLDEGTLALLAPEDDNALVLIHGSVHVLGSGPASAAARRPLRVASELASCESLRAVEAFMRVEGPGRLSIAVFSGALALDLDSASGASTQLPAGRMLEVSVRGTKLDNAPRDVSAARTLFVAQKSTPSVTGRAGLSASFAQSSAELTAERNAQKLASDAQRAAHASGAVARVHALQTEIVERAEHVIAHRRRLRTLYERRLAAACEGALEACAAEVRKLAAEYVASGAHAS